MRSLKLDDFAGCVGTSYELLAGDAAIAVTLTEAEALAGGVRESGAFKLVFLGPPAPVLPQAIYPLRRGEEVDEIFIVPIAADGAGTQYEAIFY